MSAVGAIAPAGRAVRAAEGPAADPVVPVVKGAVDPAVLAVLLDLAVLRDPAVLLDPVLVVLADPVGRAADLVVGEHWLSQGRADPAVPKGDAVDPARV